MNKPQHLTRDMPTLRVVMLAPFGIRPKGTLQARMLPLAQALVRRGHTVRIVAPPIHNPEDAGTCTTYDGVPVEHTARQTLPGPAGVAQQTTALLQAARAAQPAVCHLFKPRGFGGLAMLLAQAARMRLPLVVDTDDWEGWGGWNDLLPYPLAAKLLFAWQEYDLPRRAQAVTAASYLLRAQVRGTGVPAEQIYYLPNGIAPAQIASTHPTYERPSASRVLLYTRFWECDVRDIVALLVALTQLRPDAQLVVVGQGERGEEQTLLRLARRAGVAAQLDYRGWTQPAAIPALFAAADVALVPLDDTLVNRARCSAKLIELMAAGLPIVAARVGQVDAYLRDGISALLVPPAAPGALARQVAVLLNDPHLRQHIGSGARHAVAAFTWDQLAPIAECAYAHAAPPIYAV